MRRIGLFCAVFAVALAGTMSFAALANSWQGTWIYYNDQGEQIGRLTAGCGAADGRPGEVITTEVLSGLYGRPIRVIRTDGRVLVLADDRMSSPGLVAPDELGV